MKKLIGTFCALSTLGFAVALAHADDYSSKSTTTTTDSAPAAQAPANPSQPSGMNSDASADLNRGSSVASQTTTHVDENGNTVSSSSKWKNTKTCTDTDGVTYYRGKKGYDHCLSMMKKAKKDQMSGTVGADSVPGSVSSSPDSGDTHNMNQDANGSTENSMSHQQ